MTALLNNGTTGAIRQPINSIPKSSDGSPGVRVSIDDWKYLTSLETLPQKAGVPQTWLPRLVAKELVDNALDQSPDVTFGVLKRECGGLYVENAGAAIPGTDEAVARIFSLQRPLESSKHIRLPARGALGNGTRVVAGVVLAFVVWSCNRNGMGLPRFSPPNPYKRWARELRFAWDRA
jgi:hypothetical protein